MAGKHSFLTEDEVRSLGQNYFLAIGIDPKLNDSVKTNRYIELRNGLEQTPEEYKISLDYHNGKTSDVFHALLKHRLDQASFKNKD